MSPFLGLIQKELLSNCELVAFWKRFELVHRATHPGRGNSGPLYVKNYLGVS